MTPIWAGSCANTDLGMLQHHEEPGLPASVDISNIRDAALGVRVRALSKKGTPARV
jgi:hypothetical protein